MQNFKYIFIGILLITTSFSCKKFLTVNPKTQMPSDVLFSTESGFKDALTGAYIQMESGAAYGGALTMTTIEYLVSSWDITSNTWQQRIGLFDYNDDEVQGQFSSIFSQEYKIIASVNAILGVIDQNKSVFKTPGMYEMIKSESLAIRAYCHLDLLRLFGPVPTDPANGNRLAYVKTVSREPNDHIDFDAFKSNLLQDLIDAEALSKRVDPILEYSLNDLRSIGVNRPFNPTDDYVAYRYLRMNYLAIKALEARAYLWFGEGDKAFAAAKEVIDEKNPDGTLKFRLGIASDFSAGDYVLTTEQIFGLYDFSLKDKYTNLFGSGSLKKGTSPSKINTTLYGNSGTDIRETGLWNLITLANQAKCYVIKKYLVADDIKSLSADYRQIPMLRLSEMYLIAAESAPNGIGQEYWGAYRLARNLEPSELAADQTLKQLEILKEYRKEFYAEGQGFFAYKRLNAPVSEVVFAPTSAIVNYLVPLPKNESVN